MLSASLNKTFPSLRSFKKYEKVSNAIYKKYNHTSNTAVVMMHITKGWLYNLYMNSSHFIQPKFHTHKPLSLCSPYLLSTSSIRFVHFYENTTHKL